ncbi:MAG: DUF664 domain-containing protein [candidate division Zixibacteria bacterium]|nr:DUF664 domain-containing protein [candidate division Zixibacteria bacterium]
MDIKQALGVMLKQNEGAVKKLWDNISDEESLERGSENLTHIRWIAGHITNALGYMVNIAGGTSHIPTGWDELFRGGKEMEEDFSKYPLMDEIRANFDLNRKELYKALENIPTEELETAKEIAPDWNIPPQEALMFLVNHEFYHAGQISTMRNILGKERAFG